VLCSWLALKRGGDDEHPVDHRAKLTPEQVAGSQQLLPDLRQKLLHRVSVSSHVPAALAGSRYPMPVVPFVPMLGLLPSLSLRLLPWFVVLQLAATTLFVYPGGASVQQSMHPCCYRWL
jgi:hypothetical protein